MKYIVEGYAITNRLRYLDGRTINDIMGGGGFYAFTAVKMCTDDCLFVASVGKDIDEFYGKWFKDNNASKEGFHYQLEKTIYNELKYFKDGSYIEYSIYGNKYSDEQLEEMRKSGLVFLGESDPNEVVKEYVAMDKVVTYMDDAKGIYTSQHLTEKNTQLMLAHKQNGCKVMWEIPATAIEPTHLIYQQGGIKALKHYMRAVDIFSVNRNECAIIFGVEKDEEIIPLLKELNIPTYYRVGIDGAYMIENGRAWFVPMISTVAKEQEVDPTGCGNTSTGAVMWAYCEGYNPLMTCVIGNVVASYNVRQYGPYLDMSSNTREEMLKISQEIYNKEVKRYE